jgi:hypothetical protein
MRNAILGTSPLAALLISLPKINAAVREEDLGAEAGKMCLEARCHPFLLLPLRTDEPQVNVGASQQKRINAIAVLLNVFSLAYSDCGDAEYVAALCAIPLARH